MDERAEGWSPLKPIWPFSGSDKRKKQDLPMLPECLLPIPAV
jgi:hypothetical protein